MKHELTGGEYAARRAQCDSALSKLDQAPVETMTIRNAGHNWRKVDAQIDPTRETIVERIVQFFVDHLQQ